MQRKLFRYMQEYDIPLLEEKQDGTYKLNPIINLSNSELKNRYGIDLDKIGDRDVGSLSLDVLYVQGVSHK